jgi:hypothetical protein
MCRKFQRAILPSRQPEAEEALECAGAFSWPGLAAVTGACASYSEKTPATYVSPVIYEHLSCRQIAEEAARVSRHAAEVAGVQDSQATKDSVITGVAIVVFWPAAFFVASPHPRPVLRRAGRQKNPADDALFEHAVNLRGSSRSARV